jgi:tRNA pseudouridine32 synthase/23S rRNA pseudouridine746 synthase
LILDFLDRRFPFVGRDVWQARLESGQITDDAGRSVTEQTPYRSPLRLRYYREVEVEPRIPFEETVVYQDERIHVICKPHFLPVTPSGPCVNECLLYRQRRRTGNADLVPVNRIDRETAGLVLLSAQVSTRAKYYRLFHDGEVGKVYEAIASLPAGAQPGQEWRMESRIVRSDPGFLSRNTEGPVNARTTIRLQEIKGQWGRFLMEPQTGKRHQLRLHMARLGCQIVNDPFYPVCRPSPKTGFDAPLQLLAKRLEFTDPVTGRHMQFESTRQLVW